MKWFMKPLKLKYKSIYRLFEIHQHITVLKKILFDFYLHFPSGELNGMTEPWLMHRAVYRKC